MSYASISGRARTRPSNPDAFGVCQRCGFWYNRNVLTAQHDWRGPTLANLWIFVCPPCYDVPQENIRAITLPADPVPVYLPLTENFLYDESQNLTTQPEIDPVTGIGLPPSNINTEDGFAIALDPYGQPVGLTQAAIMPLYGKTHYGVPVPVLSLISDGSNTVRATCSQAHGLSTNDQIAVEGITNRLAAGFFSITVTTATAFTYQPYSDIPAASLLAEGSLIVTALVGLPLGYSIIPQIGPV